ncbi:MAG TPA: hypothetical protein VGA67_04645 [Candidatus Dojkabacteria bacterium]|jgi:hypothetical protein
MEIFWGQHTDTLQTFQSIQYFIDLNNLFKLEDVENAYELAVVEAKASSFEVIDFHLCYLDK